MPQALGRRFKTMVAPFAIATILGGCISPDPAPECPLVPTAPSPGISVPTFTCEAAVEAAKRALPFFHPRLTRIQFLLWRRNQRHPQRPASKRLRRDYVR